MVLRVSMMSMVSRVSEGMPDEMVGRERHNIGEAMYDAEGRPWSGVPAADEGRKEDETEARKMPKARVGDEQRVLSGGHGALGDLGRA